MEELTDNEREEQVRSFVRDNLWYVLLAVALGLAVVAGFKYWQAKRLGSAEAAQADYDSVIAALNANQADQASERAKKLRDEHPGSPYADQADLARARAAVARRDHDEAARLLRGVVDSAGDPLLRHVARTRLARVLIEQRRFDDAVALLPVEGSGAFAALYHDIRGDALAAKGDSEAARREYAEALAKDTSETGLDAAYVTLKRDSLPAATAAAVAGATPAAISAPVSKSPQTAGADGDRS